MDIGLFLCGSKNMQFRHRALHFIQITWFTYVFASVLKVTKWVQVAGSSLDLVMQ